MFAHDALRRSKEKNGRSKGVSTFALIAEKLKNTTTTTLNRWKLFGCVGRAT